MPNFEISPDGSSKNSDTIRCYDGALVPPAHVQTQEAEQNVPIDETTPSTAPSGTAPKEIVFQGVWVGSDAETLADRLRTKIADDPAVTMVDVQAVDDSYNNVSHHLNGTYTLNGEVRADPADTRKGWLYIYKIPLSEA